MRLFVRALTGFTFTFDEVQPFTTVGDIKSNIFDRSEVEVHKQHLVFGGKRWDDDSETLSNLGMIEGDHTMHLVLKEVANPDDRPANEKRLQMGL